VVRPRATEDPVVQLLSGLAEPLPGPVVRSGDIPVHRRRDPGDYACHLCSLFVVCDKDREAAANSSPFDGAAGSWTVTRSPPAARGLRVRVPSCASAMLLTIARPRPTPTPASSVRIR